ncbi:hypothetical protein [Agrobacterium tumefaciens]|uniref:hypothetical protein n=1 Tax=Agrobacterium tumefaciens TaxID=358 RepID=UPI0015746088|nr:DUF4238 domain-containing protein [Agrobacterium tumefaciens]
MAGIIQHEIPQLFQRGFLIPETGDAERVFVFRRGGKSYPSHINRSGAERYFYSQPSPTGERTLDDEITDYENRLAKLVSELRSLSGGVNADPAVSAEVIAHLTTRNAHLRGALVHGFDTLTQGAMEVFGNEANWRALFGIQTPQISDTFRNRIGEIFSKHPAVQMSGIPLDLLERFSFAALREGLSPFFEQQLPFLQQVIQNLSVEAPANVRDIHNKVLEGAPAPIARINALSTLVWLTHETAFNVILPDCVAISRDRDGQYHPLMMAAFDDIQDVYLPLTSRKILVGSHKKDSRDIDLSMFNAAAAECSHTYFISGFNLPEIASLSASIGMRSVRVVDAAISEALSSYSHENVSQSPMPPFINKRVTKNSLSIPVNFNGAFEQRDVDCISEVLTEILASAAWTIPLERLDGVTFADDYAAALHTLDRGMSDAPAICTKDDESGLGVAQAPMVIRDGVVKCHIVLRGLIGRMLISSDDAEKNHAQYVLVHELAHAGFTQVIDDALPGILLTPIQNAMDGDLHRIIYAAWNGYFAARATANFAKGRLEDMQSLLLASLKEAFTDIPEARLAYRDHGDLNILMAVASSKVAFILEWAGNLLGHAAGAECHAVEGNHGLEEELSRRELGAWLEDFGRDLEYLWERRGRWESYDEFLAINRHAERILWCFGIVPWTTPDGVYLIEVPLSTDAEALMMRESEADS